MDISMPIVDGIEATRRLVQALPGTRVIGMSTHDSEWHRASMMAAGAVACCTKGDNFDRLIELVLTVGRRRPRSSATSFVSASETRVEASFFMPVGNSRAGVLPRAVCDAHACLLSWSGLRRRRLTSAASRHWAAASAHQCATTPMRTCEVL